MSDKIEISPTPITPPPEEKAATQISPEIPGKTAFIIGSGKHAQNAIVWHVIKWSFIAASGLSLLIYVRVCWTDGCDSEAALGGIEKIWQIFIPIITLALGYVFGKGRE